LNYRGRARLLDPNADLAAVDPYDWSESGLAGVILPLPPLKEEFNEQFPWNWSYDRWVHVLYTQPMKALFS